MPNQHNKDTLVSLKERLDSAKAIVLVDYKGINVEEVNELRRRFRSAGVDYFVAKNTLIKIALNELGIKELDEYLVGPTAVAVCKADEIAPARELVKFCKEVMDDKEFPKFKHGFIGSIVMDTNELNQLAALPSREELLAKVLSGFQAPITGFVYTLSGIIRKFVYTVDAIAKQKAE